MDRLPVNSYLQGHGTLLGKSKGSVTLAKIDSAQ
jgi:hypothetical protein